MWSNGLLPAVIEEGVQVLAFDGRAAGVQTDLAAHLLAILFCQP